MSVGLNACIAVVDDEFLIAEGLTPGPAFKPLLDASFQAQLDGDITTLEEGLAFVRRLHAEHRGGT